MAYLNLTDFDVNGDMTFDADDVSSIQALAIPLELDISIDGASSLSFGWRSINGKQYDLESGTSLVDSNWAVYNDGATTYANINASGSGSNTLSGVESDGAVRFFRVIEKD